MRQERAKSLEPIDLTINHKDRARNPFRSNLYLQASSAAESSPEDMAVLEAIRLDNARTYLKTVEQERKLTAQCFNLGSENPKLVTKVKETIESKEPLGGGVFGRVWDIGADVAKTTNASEFRSFWRRVNWGFAPFPSKYSEVAAQHDSLSARIIFETMRITFGDKIKCPYPRGYVFIENLGFVQILEKVQGRGPRYDVNEIDEFAKTRELLKVFGYAAGFEQAAQIHPNNPGGLENIWWNSEGHWMQTDLHAALKHTGFVWPAFYFPFHKEIRREFGASEPTYNKIHTDRLRTFLDKLTIPGDVRQNLDRLVALYDELRPRYEEEQKIPLKEKNIDSWEVLGKVDAKKAAEMRVTTVKYAQYLLEQPLNKVASIAEKGHDFLHGKFKEVLLGGPRIAWEKRMISDAQWREVQEQFDTHGPRMTPYFLYWSSSFIFGRIKNGPEYFLYANSIKQLNLFPLALDIDPKTLAAGILVGWVAPPLFRFCSAITIGKLMNKDMSRAAVYGLLPKAAEIAVIAQVRHDLKEVGELCWHFTKRRLAVNISKLIVPWRGGWGTDAEADVWRTASQIKNLAEKVIPFRKQFLQLSRYLYSKLS